MHPALKHFTCFLDALTDLVDGVRGNVDINRPPQLLPRERGDGPRIRSILDPPLIGPWPAWLPYAQ